ncbi:hypothetical protein ACH5RR_041083, partial [Cinchona calisaya]
MVRLEIFWGYVLNQQDMLQNRRPRLGHPSLVSCLDGSGLLRVSSDYAMVTIHCWKLWSSKSCLIVIISDSCRYTCFAEWRSSLEFVLLISLGLPQCATKQHCLVGCALFVEPKASTTTEENKIETNELQPQQSNGGCPATEELTCQDKTSDTDTLDKGVLTIAEGAALEPLAAMKYLIVVIVTMRQ